jgi:hypothetical protein
MSLSEKSLSAVSLGWSNESFRECIIMNFVIMFANSVGLGILACLAISEVNKYGRELEGT